MSVRHEVGGQAGKGEDKATVLSAWDGPRQIPRYLVPHNRHSATEGARGNV